MAAAHKDDAAIIAVLRQTPYFPKSWNDAFLRDWLAELRRDFPGMDLLEEAKTRRDWVQGKVAGGKRTWNHKSGFRKWLQKEHRKQGRPTGGGISPDDYHRRIRERTRGTCS
jgi:hypothetical protein